MQRFVLAPQRLREQLWHSIWRSNVKSLSIWIPNGDKIVVLFVFTFETHLQRTYNPHVKRYIFVPFGKHVFAFISSNVTRPSRVHVHFAHRYRRCPKIDQFPKEHFDPKNQLNTNRKQQIRSRTAAADSNIYFFSHNTCNPSVAQGWKYTVRLKISKRWKEPSVDCNRCTFRLLPTASSSRDDDSSDRRSVSMLPDDVRPVLPHCLKVLT